MSDDPIRKFLAEIGKRGGQARARALTAKQRRESAIKASKAAAEARTRAAKAGRLTKQSTRSKRNS